MTLTVAFPNQQLLERLEPAPEGTEYRVWKIGDRPLGERIDLLVLEYMIPAAKLRELEGIDVGVAQSQTLGYDGVRESLPAGITYCNAVEVHEASTAELTLALILASQRGIPQAVEAQAEGRWDHQQWPGLASSRVLLIGVGGVGIEIEARLRPFDVELDRLARTARSDERGDIHGWESLPELLPTADIVILAVPLNDDTRHLVSTEFLSGMKRGALLVNVSRGPIVDTAALTEFAASGAVRAAIDVTDPEPLPADHPLWTTPGVLITPHVGGHTGAMAGRVDRLVRNQIHRLLAGEPPANVVLNT